MYSLKIKVSANNIITPKRAVGSLLSRTSKFVNVVVNKTSKRFESIVKRDLNWHSWRGGVGGSLGTFSTKAGRISESKNSGYLSTGIPYYAVPAGKNGIEFGFGNRTKIINMMTRDGTQNLADLLEYGAKPHLIPLNASNFKTYVAMNNHGKMFIWNKQADHKGFTGKYFYNRILLYLNEKVGLVEAGVRQNWTIYVKDVASGRIVGNLPAIIAKLEGRK